MNHVFRTISLNHILSFSIIAVWYNLFPTTKPIVLKVFLNVFGPTMAEYSTSKKSCTQDKVTLCENQVQRKTPHIHCKLLLIQPFLGIGYSLKFEGWIEETEKLHGNWSCGSVCSCRTPFVSSSWKLDTPEHSPQDNCQKSIHF